jgi:hypothetical protein
MACESIQQQLNGLKALQQETATQVANPATLPADKASGLEKLEQLAASISATKVSLNECLKQAAASAVAPVPATAVMPSVAAATPLVVAPRIAVLKPPTDKVATTETVTLHPPVVPGPPLVAPQRILDIQDGVNQGSAAQVKAARDAFVSARDTLLSSIRGTGTDAPLTFPEGVPVEWKQPLAPDTEYDEDSVAATGWVVHPRNVDVDFPFSHPFGVDWEFSLSLDGTSADGSGPFDFLLSPGNKGPTPPDPTDERSTDEGYGVKEAWPTASDLQLPFPLGLLGVEMDGGNLPAGFTSFVLANTGCRMAVYGRWIVDCGHAQHRCEVHPPLVMAAAATPTAGTTRALFTSRPFLVGETYTTDQTTVYDDDKSDDGTFYAHLTNEIEKVGLGSTMVEAHPKIKSYPFYGVHLAHFLIRPPAAAKRVGAVTALQHLEVSFNFTIRSGCAVEVTSSAADTVDVYIVMNQAGYKPPQLPANPQKTVSIAELEKDDPGATSEISTAEHDAEAVAGVEGLLLGGLLGAALGAAAGDLIASRGIKTDAYASLTQAVDIDSTQGAVSNVAAASIPPNQGITLNDNQPFPVYGWLEVKWVSDVKVAVTSVAKA